MPRFYIDPPAGDFVTLTGEDARHICRSLRMAVGEALTLCDGAGIDYNGVLRQTDGQIATVEILSRQPSQTEPTVSIRLFQALPKGDKMEWIIQKAVELGISEVVPVLTERCISRPDEKSMEKKLLRDACKDLLPPQLLYRKKSPYPKTYSPVYEALLAERFEQLLANPQAPVHRFMDRKKAAQFLAQPKDYGKPWFGQLMAGPQMIAYFLQVNYWMERYGIS